MILFFDTETTGVPQNYKAPVTDLGNWPRLVQLGYVIYDIQNGQDVERATIESVIRPEGFEISEYVSKIHGITQEKALHDGVPLEAVLKVFSAFAERCDLVVGHNLDFDYNIVGAEFIRCGMENPLPAKPRYDTMLKSVPVCKLPGKRLGEYKWPKLSELYQYLFHEPLAQTHTALDDIRQTAKCYFELQRLGVR